MRLISLFLSLLLLGSRAEANEALPLQEQKAFIAIAEVKFSRIRRYEDSKRDSVFIPIAKVKILQTLNYDKRDKNLNGFFEISIAEPDISNGTYFITFMKFRPKDKYSVVDIKRAAYTFCELSEKIDADGWKDFANEVIDDRCPMFFIR